MEQYAHGVRDVSGPPPTRRGCAAALGVLPCQLLAPCADAVLQALAAGIKVSKWSVDARHLMGQLTREPRMCSNVLGVCKNVVFLHAGLQWPLQGVCGGRA